MHQCQLQVWRNRWAVAGKATGIKPAAITCGSNDLIQFKKGENQEEKDMHIWMAIMKHSVKCEVEVVFTCTVFC